MPKFVASFQQAEGAPSSQFLPPLAVCNLELRHGAVFRPIPGHAELGTTAALGDAQGLDGFCPPHGIPSSVPTHRPARPGVVPKCVRIEPFTTNDARQHGRAAKRVPGALHVALVWRVAGSIQGKEGSGGGLGEIGEEAREVGVELVVQSSGFYEGEGEDGENGSKSNAGETEGALTGVSALLAVAECQVEACSVGVLLQRPLRAWTE